MTTKLTTLLAEMEEREKEFKVHQGMGEIFPFAFYLGKESEAQFIIEKLKQLLKEEK